MIKIISDKNIKNLFVCTENFYIPFIFTITLALLSCKKDNPAPKEESRPFYMGFSPWPHDATQEAIDWTYQTILSGADIVSHHMEEGVPWQESFDENDFPKEFNNEIQFRLNRHESGKKILLSINPLNMNRDGIALNRGESVTMPLPEPWKSYTLSSPEVEAAYLNYALKMVQYFKPDYLIVGIEVNLLIQNNPGYWDAYIQLHQHVYTQLKTVYPDLPIGLSVFCVPYFPEWSPQNDLAAQLEGLKDIEPWTDFISFSAHPFMSALLAETFPADYFQRLFDLTNKPISISESSYPAQSWQTMNPPVLNFNGTEEKQERFLSQMLEASANRNALFVIWFSIRDYDALWQGALNRDPVALVWRDTGLFDEAGNPRKAWETWMGWYRVSGSEF